MEKNTQENGPLAEEENDETKSRTRQKNKRRDRKGEPKMPTPHHTSLGSEGVKQVLTASDQSSNSSVLRTACRIKPIRKTEPSNKGRANARRESQTDGRRQRSIDTGRNRYGCVMFWS